MAFHRKLLEHKVVPDLTSDLKGKLASCEEMLQAGTLGSPFSVSSAVFINVFPPPPARATFALGSPTERPQLQETSQAGTRLPADMLGAILDQVQRFDDRSDKTAALSSVSLCNKTFCSLAQPRLLCEVEFSTFAQLLHSAYALDLQPTGRRDPLLVRSLQLS
jgi:hypothetical protein